MHSYIISMKEIRLLCFCRRPENNWSQSFPVFCCVYLILADRRTAWACFLFLLFSWQISATVGLRWSAWKEPWRWGRSTRASRAPWDSPKPPRSPSGEPRPRRHVRTCGALRSPVDFTVLPAFIMHAWIFKKHIGAIVCAFKCDLCPLYTQDEESITNADRRRAVDAAAVHGKHALVLMAVSCPKCPRWSSIRFTSHISLSDCDNTQESSQYADGSAGQIIGFFHLQMKVLPSQRTYTTDTFLHVCMHRAKQTIPVQTIALW